MARFAQVLLLLCLFAAAAATFSLKHRRSHRGRRRYRRIRPRVPFFRLPVNSPCTLGRSFQCQTGLKCWGFSRSDVRCTQMAPKGAACDWYRTGVHCQKGVGCVAGICGGAPPPPPPPPILLPLNAPCVLGRIGQCEVGLKCWGFSRSDVRCTRMAPKGGICDWARTGVHCQKGVECLGGICGGRQPLPKGNVGDVCLTAINCKAGLKCWTPGFGAPSRCTLMLSFGERCSDASSRRCSSPFKCIGGICGTSPPPLPGLGDLCTAGSCTPGLKCWTDGTGPARCTLMVGAGGRCSDAASRRCNGTLACIGGICGTSPPPLPGLGALCPAGKCMPGLKCWSAGVAPARCTRMVSAGQPCDNAASVRCSSPNKCIGGICGTIPPPLAGVGALCPNGKCKAGLKCWSDGSASFRCTLMVRKGGSCDAAASRRCSKPFTCVGGICRAALPAQGEPCPTGLCQAGLKCWTDGTSPALCTLMVSAGQPCDNAASIRCSASNKCVAGVCSPPTLGLPPLPVNAACGQGPRKCAKGLKCWGFTSSDLRCTRLAPKGGACNWQKTGVHCRKGVKCIKGICGGRLPLNAPCVLGGKGQCQAGLKCWGFSRTDTRCTKLAPRGAKCDWQLTGVHCEKGVKCVGGVCGRPARVVKVTEKCDGKRTICGPNAACLAGHCFIVSPVGGKCGTNPFYVCEGGNVCVHGKCKSGAQCKC